jgi:hypothetical protein
MADATLDALKKRCCPDCETPGLIAGPRGGASQNFYCGQCGFGWNLHGVDHGGFAWDAIGQVDPETLELYRSGKLKPTNPTFH